MPRLKAAIVPVTPFQQNCAIVFDEASKRGAVVDPGGEIERIQAAIAELGVTVEKILLTHGHIDHAGGAAALREALSSGRDCRSRSRAPTSATASCSTAWSGRAANTASPGVRNVLPDRWLVEGDTVEVGGHEFAVLHCPGHTPGHIVLHSKADRFALVGDVLFRGSVGRTDFPYGDGPALIRSIREKLFPLGDEVSFLCGHGPGSTIALERRTNPYAGERAG